MRGSLSLACLDCGEGQSFKRMEPRVAGWLPIRYPGVTWITGTTGPEANASCAAHRYHVSVQSDMKQGSLSANSAASDSISSIYVNGILATPDNTGAMLKALMAPNNFGVAIGPGP